MSRQLTSEIEYAAADNGQADDLLRQATHRVLHADAAGRLGWRYTGPREHTTALARLLDERGEEYVLSPPNRKRPMRTWIVHQSGAAHLAITGPTLVEAIETNFRTIARAGNLGGPAGYRLVSVHAEQAKGWPGVQVTIVHQGLDPFGDDGTDGRSPSTAVVRIYAHPADLPEPVDFDLQPNVGGRPPVGRPTQIRFAEDTYAELDRRAAEEGITRSELVRRLVDAALGDKVSVDIIEE